MKKLVTDLFCGAGGTSTGIFQAGCDLDSEIELLAINHWQTAVNTHSLNHPGVRHICGRLENIKPDEAIPGGYLDLLTASPECIGHSNAAGGRPKNDQSRCQAWIICDWLTRLNVESLLIENVREFINWGRLTKKGKPNKRFKGEYFKAFLQTLGNMGYRVEYRVVNAADFGDPTSRKRLLIMARRGRKFDWPSASHFSESSNGQGYRTAREIIDWDLKGQSIFRRKKALSPNTIRRIAAGLRKFGDVNAEPFLVMLYGTNDARDINRPLPTVTANGGHIGLAQPFVAVIKGASDAATIDGPLPTTTTKDHLAVVEPFIIHLTHAGNRRQHSLHEPLPTVTSFNRGEMALVEPFVANLSHGKSDSIRSVNIPLSTITTAKGGELAVCEPIIVKYYGTATAQGINQPLDTVTSNDRFLLVEPKTGKDIAELDILFRMLQPHELAAAMSFPKGYQFTGTRGDQVRQIGNAVPVQLARAHARALLS